MNYKIDKDKLKGRAKSACLSMLQGVKKSVDNYFIHQFNNINIRKIFAIIVIVNVIAIILSTSQSLNDFTWLFNFIFRISTFIFLLEYVSRLYASGINLSHKKAFASRFKYATSFMGVVDLLSIIPYLVHTFDLTNHAYYELTEIAKICIMFKLMRYSRTYKIIIEVFKSVRNELLFAWVIAFSIVVFSGVLMYYVERNAQPDVFYNAGQGLWWSIITFATVGYGDVYPITFVGKVLAGIIAFIGIGMLALPVGIISSAFTRKINELNQKIQSDNGEGKHSRFGRQNHTHHNELSHYLHSDDQLECKQNFCPHCGAPLNKHKEKK